MTATDSPSRFAELATELLGAKAAAELIREVWATASPEVRQQLADAVVRKLTEEIAQGHGFRASDALRYELDKIGKEVAQQKAAEMEQATRAELDRVWEKTVRQRAEDVVQRVLREVGMQVVRRLSGEEAR